MRSVVFVSMCVCVLAQDLNVMVNMPKYEDRYDYLDVDALFTNKRLVRNYVDCLINSHRCTPEGKALKRILPEALRTKCVRCTERQKKTAVKVIKRLKYEYPEEWAKVAARWDPTGDFTRYFEEFLAKNQYNIIPGSDGVNEIAGSSPIPTQRLPPIPPSPAPSIVRGQSVPPQSTPPRPIVLNRFGGDGELMMGGPSSGMGTTPPPSTNRPARPSTMRSITMIRPSPSTWADTPPNTMTTLFPRPTSSVSPVYTTAITLIDQISFKILRTTELVADIFKNTVRAVAGR